MALMAWVGTGAAVTVGTGAEVAAAAEEEDGEEEAAAATGVEAAGVLDGELVI